MIEAADRSRSGRAGFAGRWAAARICLTASTALAVLVGVAATALAQNPDSQALNKRIDRLERLLYLSGAPAAGGAPAARPGPGATLEGGPIAARMDVRITALEGALANQTGPIEEILHRLDRMESRLEKLVADIDFRLRGLEGAVLGGAMAGAPPPDPSPSAAAPLGVAPDPATVAATLPPSRPGVLGTLTMGDMQAARLTQTGAGAATPVAAAAPPPPPLVSLPPGPPRMRYDFARSLLKRARYDEAESAFRQFIAAHGDDPLAGNAQYWLAETFYVRGRYEESAKTYLDGYQKFPEGVKAPDNLLKLGVSLARLGDSAEACTAFDKLADSFPDATQPIKQRAQRERARISCP
jgi:tol-pal system protein YbgF